MTGTRHRRLQLYVVLTVLVAAVVSAAPALAQYPPGSSSECAALSDTTPTANQNVTISGDAGGTRQCFDPDSTVTGFFIQSETRIASVRTDANGDFSLRGTIPSTARAGAASIETRGTLNGDPRTYSTAVTVAAAAGAGLPTTGRDIAVMVAWGVGLVVVGTLLVRLARRRRARARVTA